MDELRRIATDFDSMEEAESMVEAILDEDEEGEWSGDETLDEDLQMLNALSLDAAAAVPSAREAGPLAGDSTVRHPAAGQNQKLKPNTRAMKKRKKKKMKSGADSITDINRFVMDTCKHLREKKPYLVWNAVGSLGVSAVRDIVKEVDIIQRCGGQKTADGRRLRTGGGILWNILKSREPKAYKEIMEKGREFEKQFRQPKRNQTSKQNEQAIHPHGPDRVAAKKFGSSVHVHDTQKEDEQTHLVSERTSLHNRIRMPVAYDDLYEEGEIRD